MNRTAINDLSTFPDGTHFYVDSMSQRVQHIFVWAIKPDNTRFTITVDWDGMTPVVSEASPRINWLALNNVSRSTAERIIFGK